MERQPYYARLLPMLCCLMLLFIAWQVAFFSIHYHVSNLIDSLTNTSIATDLFHFFILAPIIGYILIQLFFYVLITYYIYAIAISVSNYFRFPPLATYWFGLFCLSVAIADLLAFNSYYFPFSFFAWGNISYLFLGFSVLFWCAATLIALPTVMWLLLAFITLNIVCALPTFSRASITKQSQPNIILIGLDSLRPDFTGFFGNQKIRTPHIDQFLQHSSIFTAAYTPLARTFPSWISILTAQYPKHSGARNNLADFSAANTDTLAKKLQQAGYFTVYASDEKRFSNITAQFGFDNLAGPNMGVNDFILGGLSDFPVANLITKLPIAKFILPYNYANRAAAITYNPKHFLSQVGTALAQRPNKPLFLAIHLCLTHWPFTWASAAGKNESQAQQYSHSVEAIDRQFGQLIALLKHENLLKNSIVVLLSDHGTTLGLAHDTLLEQKKYLGEAALLKNVPISRFSNTSPYSADFKHDYSMNTAYGQGTNVTSLKQYNTLLAFQRFGDNTFTSQKINLPVMLIDIAPTLLAILKMPALKNVDGISLASNVYGKNSKNTEPRAFFIETGDSLNEIETDHIYLEKVIAKKMGIYRVNAHTGLLTIDTIASRSVNLNKQRAIIYGDWLLARFPAVIHNKLVPVNKQSAEVKIQPFVVPAYYLLVNIKSGQWTIGLNTPFANTAPVALLNSKLHQFYGDEL